jgi:alkylation response protein AidB-like acyl-CoA dehydrogenase
MTQTLQNDLPTRAKAVGALAAEHADYGDKNGRLAQEVVDAFHREGLYAMWVPRSLGGAELDPISSLQVIEQVAYGDPSAGWVLMASALAIGTGAAYLQDDAVKALFSGPKVPVIAGQGTRPGVAKPVDGGYRLTGSWSFASGIKHGTHIHTLGLIEGTNEARIFVLPVEQATLIDNWDVMGLRATGSIDYRIDDVFVPEGFTHIAVTESPKRGGALYRGGIVAFATICHSALACGIGRRLLDECAANVRARGGRAGTQATSETFLEEYAKAEGTYRAGRALVYESWTDAWQAMERGDELSQRQHSLIRLGMAHVTWASHDAAMFVYRSAGTNGLRAGTIQRLFRDMHAATQHLLVSPVVFRAIGKELAGLATNQRWVLAGLIDN